MVPSLSLAASLLASQGCTDTVVTLLEDVFLACLACLASRDSKEMSR